MRVKIDQTSPMPIYAQVMEQVRWAVFSGALEAGDQLPTVRQLAVELRINPNTVARAYSELERLGMIATQQGRGTFVTANDYKVPEKERKAVLRRLAREFIAEAGALGFSEAEVAREVYDITGQEDTRNADNK